MIDNLGCGVIVRKKETKEEQEWTRGKGSFLMGVMGLAKLGGLVISHCITVPLKGFQTSQAILAPPPAGCRF